MGSLSPCLVANEEKEKLLMNAIVFLSPPSLPRQDSLLNQRRAGGHGNWRAALRGGCWQPLVGALLLGCGRFRLSLGGLANSLWLGAATAHGATTSRAWLCLGFPTKVGRRIQPLTVRARTLAPFPQQMSPAPERGRVGGPRTGLSTKWGVSRLLQVSRAAPGSSRFSGESKQNKPSQRTPGGATGTFPPSRSAPRPGSPGWVGTAAARARVRPRGS